GQLTPDGSLQALGLDSIAMAELLVVVEEATGAGIPLTDERMPVGADVTIAAMADYVALFTDESTRAALLALTVAPTAAADA
ncbi:acyl carrier protein, partial [Streptomyces sp. NPDC059525]|uniref:acyl carrier protein n=1 Tax=Streptomyces sp. NPDC059525 TaxID=3346857 RepID=UPI0036C2985E